MSTILPLRLLAVMLVGVVYLSGCGGKEQPKSPEARFDRLGRQIYSTHCQTCHQSQGQGVAGVYPPLQQTEWAEGDKGRLIRLVLNGLSGPVEVKGQGYDNVMTPHDFLSDDQIAAVLTHVRQHFGNDASAVTPEEVAAVRAAIDREKFWTPSELEKATGIPAHPQP